MQVFYSDKHGIRISNIVSISSLTITKPDKAQEMVIKLSDFLRYSLSHDKNEKTPLKEEFNNIPDNKDLIAQYLLLYEMSGDPANLWRVVDDKYQKANLTFQLKSDNSKAINSAIAEVERFRDEFRELGVKINFAGSGYKALVFTDLILVFIAIKESSLESFLRSST
jgi:hypothetical protein